MKNIKNRLFFSLIFSLIFGLLSCKSTLGMHNLVKQDLIATNAFSVFKAFLLGVYTPQKGYDFKDYQTPDVVKKAYFIAQLITGGIITFTGVKTGLLNNLVYGTGKYNITRWAPLALNIAAYLVGALIRTHLDRRDPRKESLSPMDPKAAEIINNFFWFILVPGFTLTWKTVYDDTFKRLDQHINKSDFKIDFLHTSPECIKYIINKKPRVIFDKNDFINAIDSIDQKQLDMVLNHAIETYQQYPETYTNTFIDCFMKVITSYQKPSPEQLKLLIHFFEKFQTLGCDLSKYDGLYHLLSLCKNHDILTNQMVAEKYMHALVYDIIKYCVEMGMSLYTKCSSCHDNMLTDHIAHTSIMENYFKMVGRYNKTLLTDKENLGKFLQKLNANQQDDIFCVAASRGHLHTLTLLTTLHPKRYSLAQAAHLALLRNLEKVLIKYFSVITDLHTHFRKTIKNPQQLEFLKNVKAKVDYNSSRALDTMFQKNDINNGEKEVITLHIKDMILRAHSTKFAKWIQELRQHQEEFEYRSAFYKTLK